MNSNEFSIMQLLFNHIQILNKQILIKFVKWLYSNFGKNRLDIFIVNRRKMKKIKEMRRTF